VDKYRSFQELRQQESEGTDYQIVAANENEPVLVMAPHGGGIEEGTTELARGIAGGGWGFYSFMGIKKKCNYADLHITSTCFDEPRARKMAASSSLTVTIHGCKGASQEVYIGGLDDALKIEIVEALTEGGFHVSQNPKFPGIDPANICNRNRSGKGVQLEITAGLRGKMFNDYPFSQERTPVFEDFVRAVRSGISKRQGRGLNP